MRICMVALGTQGDVRPLLALAAGLRSAGEHVTVATHRYFERMVVERGLGFEPIEGNPRDIIDSRLGRGWVQSGTNPLRFTRYLRSLAGSLGQELMVDCYRACRGAHAIITGLLGYFAAGHVAERLDVPLAAAFLQPVTPSRHLPSVFFADVRAPAPARRYYNFASHLLVELMFWSMLRREVNRAREAVLGLPEVPRLRTFARNLRGNLVLYGFSPTVLPPPADWPPEVRVTGYWFLDESGAGRQPEAALAAFLQRGAAPVYVGFGSMSGSQEEALTAIVLTALRRCGLRGVLATGWGGLGAARLPDDMLMLDWVPHDWLFPRSAAIIHHGGAGTTATGLRCGVPQVIVPFFGDQHFWGQRVHELGVGPAPVARRRLTAARLTAALAEAAGDPRMRARAAAAAARIRAEDGVGNAVAEVRRALRERVPA